VAKGAFSPFVVIFLCLVPFSFFGRVNPFSWYMEIFGGINAFVDMKGLANSSPH